MGQHDPAGFGGQFGYYTDTETGLLCLTHRYYDPGTGKFINRDPIGYAGGANLYGFCEGNPVNDCDPNGTQSIASPTDSMQYVGGMFDTLTPHDYFHALKHNDTTHAVEVLVNGISYIPGPENLLFDAKYGVLAFDGFRVAAPAAKTTVIASVMHTLELSGTVWRQTKFGQKGLVYVLRDVGTGEVLKVGQTVASKFIGRFEKYVTAGVRNGRKLAVDVIETSESMRGQVEGEIRRTMGSSPRSLPWDNTGRRLGRPGPRVP